jgi:hypothetical protein
MAIAVHKFVRCLFSYQKIELHANAPCRMIVLPPVIATGNQDRIVWLDLEMYSLEDHRVLECAVVLTTCNELK